MFLAQTGSLPEVGDAIDVDGVRWTVCDLAHRRIVFTLTMPSCSTRTERRRLSGVGILLTAVLLAANAFFVGAEFALVSARRSVIEPRADAGSRRARTTLRAMENISLMMAGAQLGITVCSLALGALSEPAIAHLVEPGFESLGVPEAAVHPVAFVLALGLVTVLHVVLGEMVPKNIALAGPERSALWLRRAAGRGRARAASADLVAEHQRERRVPAGRCRPEERGDERVHPRRGRGHGRRVAPRGPARRGRARAADRRDRLHPAHGARGRPADGRPCAPSTPRSRPTSSRRSPSPPGTRASRCTISVATCT